LIHGLFGIVVVPQKFLPKIGVAEVLHLQPLIFAKRGEQQRQLILKVVEFRDLGIGQVGRLENEPLGDTAAFAQSIEDNEVAEEITVVRISNAGIAWSAPGR
jgi:hypothetical protein